MKCRGMTVASSRNHQTYRNPLSAVLTICAIVLALALVATNPAWAQTYSVIHEFTSGAGGANPQAGMVMDHGGNLYGTTIAGGGGTCPNFFGQPGCGTVFKFNPSSGRFSVLYQFTGGTDGAAPVAPLLVASDGTLYGSTTSGGVDSCAGYEGLPGCGVVFHLHPRPTPPRTALENYWLETPLYSFQGSPDGNTPMGDLAMDESGDVYGSTLVGGSQSVGSVFELTSSAGGWSESILHDFLGGTSDGLNPYGGVTLKAGDLYGTTAFGGADNNGTVVQLIPSSGGWMENLLYSFPGSSNGGPYSGVTFDSAGNLYTSTLFGGSGEGTVFELYSGSWGFNLIYSFANGGPLGSDLIFDQSGNIYGTTAYGGAYGLGSVFKLTPTMGGYIYTSLHDFCAGGFPCSDGAFPYATLVMDSSGNLYGTTDLGGSNLGVCTGGTCGVIFKITQ